MCSICWKTNTRLQKKYFIMKRRKGPSGIQAFKTIFEGNF